MEAARDVAEQANRSKSEFLANMSHEIRTPMNGILGLIQVLKDSELDEVQHEYVHLVHSSARNLLDILNTLLDFSKIEAGQLEMESVPFDLHYELELLIASLASVAEQKQLTLRYRAQPELPVKLVGDPVRVRQVITNLVGNALKFTSEGEVRVEVEGTVDGNLAHLKLTISDTGIGIPPDRIESIFDKFTQVDATTTRRFGGTGLGLSIVRELVQLMGGEIHVESALGRGTRFCIQLPFAVREPAVLEQREGRALIVTDDATTAAWVAESLSAHGWEPEIAPEPASLEAIPSGQYVLAVIDEEIGAKLMMNATRVLGTSNVVALHSFTGASAAVPGVRRVLRLLAPTRIARALPAANRSVARPENPPAPTDSRVLIVEDNPVNQKVATSMLRTAGYQVETAANGEEAIAKATEQRFDVILMDCQMPVMDGYRATTELQRRDPDGTPPIIALTAHALGEHRQRCLDAGMNDYLAKPFEKAKLLEIVARWTSRKRAGDTADRS